MWLQVNAADTLGQTALHRAALAGHIQTCKLLLSYGADPAIVSLQGFTAAQMGNEAVQQILNGSYAFQGLIFWFALRPTALFRSQIQKMFPRGTRTWTTGSLRQPKQETWTRCR